MASFDKAIEDAIESARCVLVVWSIHSVESDWVRAEATEGLRKNILVQILLDVIKPPLLFRQRQALSLIEWRHSPQNQRLNLESIMPSVVNLLNRDQSSSLPVSTQKSWVLAKVLDETADKKIDIAVHESIRLALAFFPGLIVFDGDENDDPHDIASNEGLTGVISFHVHGMKSPFSLSLVIHETSGGNQTFKITGV